MTIYKLLAMLTRVCQGKGVCAACIFVLAAMQFAVPSHADQQAPGGILKKPVSLKGQHQSLTQIIGDVADQSGANIIIDGEPFVKEADIDLKGTLKEALDSLSDKFDYTWTSSKQGTILMHKRFKNPEEYPQLNVPELRQTAREVLDVLSGFVFDAESSHYPININLLYHSFTPEQVHTLQADQPLYGYQLAPAQFDLMRQLIMSNLFGETQRGWERFAQQMDTQFNAMPETQLQLRSLSPNYRSVGEGKPKPLTLKYNSFEYIYHDKSQTLKRRSLVLIPVN